MAAPPWDGRLAPRPRTTAQLPQSIGPCTATAATMNLWGATVASRLGSACGELYGSNAG